MEQDVKNADLEYFVGASETNQSSSAGSACKRIPALAGVKQLSDAPS